MPNWKDLPYSQIFTLTYEEYEGLLYFSAELEPTVENDFTINDEASAYIFSYLADNDISVSDETSAVLVDTHLDNGLSIAQNASGVHVDTHLSGGFVLSDEATYTVAHGRSVSHNIELSTEQTVVWSKTPDTYLILESTASVTYEGDLVEGLTLSDSAEINWTVEGGGEYLNLSQNVEAEVIRGTDPINLVLSDNVSRILIVGNRDTVGSFQISQFVYAYLADASNSTGRGYTSTDGICDDEEGGCNLQDHISLAGIGFIELSNPFSDSFILEQNMIVNRTRGEELHVDKSQPNFKVLSYIFERMTRSERDNFIQFYIANAGKEVTLTDYCGVEWVGVIRNHDIQFDQSGNGVNVNISCPEVSGGEYDFAFEFEGEKV